MAEIITENNARALELEIEWFFQVVDTRIRLHFSNEGEFTNIYEIQPPEHGIKDSAYGSFINHYGFSMGERVIFVLSLLPHIKPRLLDVFLTVDPTTGRQVTEFGGRKDPDTGSFIPTAETALFILAGDNLKERFNYYHLFDADHYFVKHNILKTGSAAGNEYNFNLPLSVSSEIIDLITTGRVRKPIFGPDFPAKRIDTELEWDDLILEPYTHEQIMEIKTWIEYGPMLLDGMGLGRKLKPGYRSLFYGPPGTGKTLTAALLGKVTGLDVYRIDLSMIISKYIGETEKNLEKIFQQAEYKDWILFFDEADALFGKRTGINDAHDRFANQEISYLLQRVEDYPGVVILASNMKTNIDEAFTRRFQSIIYFPMPRVSERYKLWRNSFSEKSKLEDKIDLRDIASKYELAGGSIMNVIRYATLMSLKKNNGVITLNDLDEGIRKEFQKEGKKL